jgi:AraC-like DNA-binding protein
MQIKVKGNQAEEIEGLFADYPYVFHNADFEDTKVPWHWHEELELDYIVKGSVRVDTLNKSYIFHKNQAFFVNSDVLCTMGNDDQEQSGKVESHLFHPVFLSGHFKSIFATKYLNPVLQNKKLEILEIRGENRIQQEILEKLRRLSYIQKKENMEFQTRNILSEIWILLLDEIQRIEAESIPQKIVSKERIQTMMTFIQRNYDQKISLEDIALSAAVSKRECLRCFQHGIHKTPYEYLLNYRIEMAQKLLKETDTSIIEIAFLTGFTNGAYFGKMFKKISQKTPGAYRKAYRISSSEM